MALLDIIGEVVGLSSNKLWTLEMIDPPNTKFSGQFLAENTTENIGSRINTQQSLNADSSNKQWVGGQDNTFTFNARIYALDGVKDVASKIAKLKSFTKKRDDLSRAPMFIFSLGTQLSFSCLVATVGGIRYDELRSDGTLRGATFSIELSIIDEKQTDGSVSLASKIKNVGGIISSAVGFASGFDLINIPGGSLHTIGRTATAKDGDTFESIAALEYGDALVGDVLRRANVEIFNIQAGDDVVLVDRQEIFQIEVTPQSNALKDEEQRDILRQEFLELRGQSKTVFI